jgi:hypothetical protein
MALRAGTKQLGPYGEDQYTGSMAAAIESAFIKEWPVIMGSNAPAPNDHMRLLFVAIAQGIVRHLKENDSSITVSVPGVGTLGTNIETEDLLYTDDI